MTLKNVGKSKPRYNGLGHVTGEARYVDDIFVPGTLAVKALRSPVHKGIIRKLDISKAEKLPGVYGVITAADVPCNTYGYLTLDQAVLADKAVRFMGEPIAAVAADTGEIANEALDLISLDIEQQTPVFDPLEAMKLDAPKVRPEGNVLMVGTRPYRLVYNGDIEKGFLFPIAGACAHGNPGEPGRSREQQPADHLYRHPGNVFPAEAAPAHSRAG